MRAILEKEEKLLEELKLIQQEIIRATRTQWQLRTVMLFILGGIIGISEKKIFKIDWIIFTIFLLLFSSFFVMDYLILRSHVLFLKRKSKELKGKLGFSQSSGWPRIPEVISTILFGSAVILAIIKIIIML